MDITHEVYDNQIQGPNHNVAIINPPTFKDCVQDTNSSKVNPRFRFVDW